MIHLQQVDGVWWLVDLEGERFVSLGVNHFQSDCWIAPYNKQFMLDKYGDDLADENDLFNADSEGFARLVDATKERVADLGFNTFGLHTYEVPHHMLSDDFYYLVAIEYFPLGSRFKFGEQRFPDIFSQDFEQDLDAHIRKVCQAHCNHDRFMGYAFSDIPRWYFFEGKPLEKVVPHPWVADMLQLPEGSAGRVVLENALNEMGSSIVCTTEQNEHLLSLMVQRWYALHVKLIHQYDPGRLIFGDKLHSPHQVPGWYLDVCQKYVDVILIQWYLPIEQQRKVLIELYEKTGKPILNGDSSFGCAHPPEQTVVKGYKVASREAVGEAYADYLEGLMRLPFMLGWHHCGLMEQWDGGKRRDWEINENGFFSPFEEPYESVTIRVMEANKNAHMWHVASLIEE